MLKLISERHKRVSAEFHLCVPYWILHKKKSLLRNIFIPSFRCAVTGRARGIFHQFRVSRFVFRKEADGNRVSGVQYAKWLYNTHLDP